MNVERFIFNFNTYFVFGFRGFREQASGNIFVAFYGFQTWKKMVFYIVSFQWKN